MNKSKLIIILLVMLPQIFISYLSFGQLQTVNGKVVEEDGIPIIGVNVVIQGTTTGTTTNVNGEFKIEASAKSTLVFSFVGYNSKNVLVGNQSVINVTLVQDQMQLSDVVVVGYGSMKKSDISGSVASVNTEEMMKKAPTNVLQALQGAAAGVLVMAQDGAPDANASIRIRGVATINGIADPLYVVDGVQVGTNADFIAPSDIASIEILKDASATAIYGSAGANGVIMITTKHGKVGTTSITFTADYGVQTLASKLDVVGAEQYAKNIRTARAFDGAVLQNQVFAEKYDGKRKTIDWQDEMTQIALKQQYSLSASGGTEKTQSNFSLTYLDHDGVVVNTNYNRLTARANVITKVANFIEVGGDINFIHSESQGSNGGLGNNGNLSSIRDMAFLCPTMDYVDPITGDYVSPNAKNSNGTYGSPLQGSLGAHDGMLGNNVLAEQMENTGINKNNQVITSAYIDVKLFKGLNFKSIGSYNFSAGNDYNFWGNKERYMPDGVTQVELFNYDKRYEMNISNSNYNTMALESYLTYNWNNELHNLTLMAGNSVRKSFGNWSSATAKDFPAENIRDVSLTSDPTTRTGSGAYNLESRGISFFGRASYSLMDRYILTATVRRDGSSNFGEGNRWGTFPSAALAWRISEESFMENVSAISNLKLRLGWGQTGNSGGATDKATAALTSNTIQYFFYPEGGSSGLGTSRILANGYVRTLVDTNLKWETNEQTNIGLDFGILNNALNITMDYFIRTSKDLLLNQAIRPSAGYNEVYTNYGEIQNKGLELSINYQKKINNDLTIGATITGSTIKNEIISIGSDLYFENTSTTNDGSNVGAIGAPSGTHWNNHSIMREGYAVGSFYGFQVDGIFQTQNEVDDVNNAAVAAGHEQYQNAGTSPGDFKYKDLNNDGFVNEEDMTILGNGFPKANLGLNINVAYKNFDLGIYTHGIFGADIYSYSAMTLSNMFPSDNGTTPNLLNEASQNAWTAENKSTSMSKLTFLDLNYNMRGSDKWVKKGDFFKIDNIQIGYNFDKNLLTQLNLGGIRLYAAIQNVATFSSYNKYGDPEVGQGSVLYTGLDTGRYPMPRTYSFGLNIQF
ncbi:MAG TPA: TonB-dependent receptor [Prolixibacteraceae bacterium]|nr:TonB-dependent receptor [Prolixibacteraceae bacterium]